MQSGGLKCVTDEQKEAHGHTRAKCPTRHLHQVAAIDYGEQDRGQRHANGVEQEWRNGFKRFFNKDKSSAPDESHENQEEMGFEGTGHR